MVAVETMKRVEAVVVKAKVLSIFAVMCWVWVLESDNGYRSF